MGSINSIQDDHYHIDFKKKSKTVANLKTVNIHTLSQPQLCNSNTNSNLKRTIKIP